MYQLTKNKLKLFNFKPKQKNFIKNTTNIYSELTNIIISNNYYRLNFDYLDQTKKEIINNQFIYLLNYYLLLKTNQILLGPKTNNKKIFSIFELESHAEGDITDGITKLSNLLELIKINTLPITQTFYVFKIKQDSFLFNLHILKKKSKIITEKMLPIETNFGFNLQLPKIKPRIKTLVKIILQNLLRKYNYLKSLHKTFFTIKNILINNLMEIFTSQNVSINRIFFEIITKRMFSRIYIINLSDWPFFPKETININLYSILYIISQKKKYLIPFVEPLIKGLSKSAKISSSPLSSISFQQTIKVLTRLCLTNKKDWINNIKSNILVGNKIPIGTFFFNGINRYTEIENIFDLT